MFLNGEKAMSDKAKQELAKQIKAILRGIDAAETDRQDGWWETSAGAEFGAGKLEEVLSAIKAWNTRTEHKWKYATPEESIDHLYWKGVGPEDDELNGFIKGFNAARETE